MKLSPHSVWLLPILAGLVAIGPLSIDMYLPAQPTIKNELAASIEQMQMTLSIFMIGTSLALPFWGPLADRFGRRPILVSGFLLFILSSVGCAYAQDIQTLIFFRLMQSIGACVGPTIGRTMVRDIYGAEGAARAFGYLASMMALAPAIAPVIGGFLVEHFNWRVIFYVLAFLAIITSSIYLIFIGETMSPDLRQSIHPLQIVKNYKGFFYDPVFLAYTMMLSFIFSGLFAFISASSFIFIEFLELTPQQFSYCFLGMVCGFVIGSTTGGRLSGSVNPSTLILTGIVIGFLSGLLGLMLSLLEIFNALAVVIPIAFYAMGTGAVLPQCNAASLKHYPHIAGTASSFSGIIQNTLAAVIGLIVASLHSETPTTMMIFISACAAAALLFFIFLLPKKEKQVFNNS